MVVTTTGVLTALLTALTLILSGTVTGLALAAWRRTGSTGSRRTACLAAAGGVVLLGLLHRAPLLLAVALLLVGLPVLLGRRERPGVTVRDGRRRVRVDPAALPPRWARPVSASLRARTGLREAAAAAAPGAVRDEIVRARHEADALVPMVWRRACADAAAEGRARRLDPAGSGTADRAVSQMAEGLDDLVGHLVRAAGTALAMTARPPAGSGSGSGPERTAEELAQRLEALQLAATDLEAGRAITPPD